MIMFFGIALHLNEDVFVFRAVGELQKNSLSWVKLVQE
jgi:hypothetical protein